MTGGPDWRALFARLDALPPGSPTVYKQRRGADFEHVLDGMFQAAGMDPRSRFRPAGEEIDGSFLHRGQIVLFEAKWTSGPIPASTLYQFRGKLDGKLAGTLGVFISMAGYSEDAVDALVAGKSLNLILFDGSDIRKLAQPDCIDIEAALDLKLRAAAEEGTPFVPLPPCIGEPRQATPSVQVVIVEGQYDDAIIRALFQVQRVQGSLPIIVIAMGILNLPLVALAQLSLRPDVRRIILIADGDGSPEEVKHRIQDTLSNAAVPSEVEIVTVVVDPNLETTLGIVRPKTPPGQLTRVLRRQDLGERAAANADLRVLLETLGLID